MHLSAFNAYSEQTAINRGTQLATRTRTSQLRSMLVTPGMERTLFLLSYRGMKLHFSGLTDCAIM